MFPLIKEFQPCRWRRAHLIAESPDGFVLDYIKVEVKRRRWWDPLGLVTGNDRPGALARSHRIGSIKGCKWKLDYTNTAEALRKWSDYYQKYIRLPPPDVNGNIIASWTYNYMEDVWEPDFWPPYLEDDFPEAELDCIWHWDDSKGYYVMVKEYCERIERPELYNPNLYYTKEGLQGDV